MVYKAEQTAMGGPTGAQKDPAAEFAGILGSLQEITSGFQQTQTSEQKAGNLLGLVEIGGEDKEPNHDPAFADDQHLTGLELQVYLQKQGVNITLDEANAFVDAYDTDKTGAKGLDQKELAVALDTKPITETPPSEQGGGGESGGGQQAGGAGQSGGSGQSGGAGQPSGAEKLSSDLLELLMKLLNMDDEEGVSEKDIKAFLKKYAGADGKLTKEELIKGLKEEAAAKGVTLSDEQIESVVSGLNLEEGAKVGPEQLTQVLTDAGVIGASEGEQADS